MSTPSRLHRNRPHRRRSVGVWLAVWLLVALLPVRAWAWAEMTGAMATTPAAAAAADAASLPPCHGAVDDAEGSEAQDHAAHCALCLFCTPMLAAGDLAVLAMPRPQALRPAGPPGRAPEGARHALFRPPRG
jgi:hypothetical protein